MKIVYNQRRAAGEALHGFGVSDCYFKDIAIDSDRRYITPKAHHHAAFELHLVTEGMQAYEVNGKHYRVEAGRFLLIYPGTVHTVGTAAPFTRKVSVVFCRTVERPLDCFFGESDARMTDNVERILSEAAYDKEISPLLIEHMILELLVLIFRAVGIKETTPPSLPCENEWLALAKQYLQDNLESAPSVADVAEYCHLSTKQLTRIFHRYEGCSPGEFLIDRRVERIAALLADPTLSLRQISLRMHFDNEYYFNAFFKKHAGMPPGEYRKTLGQ